MTDSTSRKNSPTVQLAGQLVGGVRRFMAKEPAGAAVLLGATLAALVWANSPWGAAYEDFWSTHLNITLGGASLDLDLEHWVNDGLMVFFFFVLGLEVKRELMVGELSDPRRAAVPIAAAVAGLAVPALIYLALKPSGAAAAAWGVVISTDTAFLLGILALLGPKGSQQLRIFLLTLSIADDVGALTVIAFFYTDDIAWGRCCSPPAASRSWRRWRGSRSAADRCTSSWAQRCGWPPWPRGCTPPSPGWSSRC